MADGVHELRADERADLEAAIQKHGYAHITRVVGLSRSALSSLLAGRARGVTVTAYRARVAQLPAPALGEPAT